MLQGLMLKKSSHKRAFFKKSKGEAFLTKIISNIENIFLEKYLSIKVYGQENIDPNTTYLICANHSSHIDNIAIKYAFAKSNKEIIALAAKDYFFVNIFRYKLASLFLKIVPFDRGKNKKAILKNFFYIKKYNGKGFNIILYPEGTRSQDGNMLPFKLGTAYYRSKLHLNIIPIYIDSTYKSMRKGNIFPRKTKVSLIIGKPILYLPESDQENLRDFTSKLRNTILELSKKVPMRG